LPDCLRYALQTWPALPLGPPPDGPPPPRDLSKLPDEMRGAIERMRRLDAPPKDPDMSTVADDFFA
jgi:hypothetical protein